MSVIRPDDRAGRHRIDPHLRRKLDRQRTCEGQQSTLSSTIERVACQRPLCMDVRHVDNRPSTCFQLGGKCLSEEKRCAKVAPDQIVPVAFGNPAKRGGKKARRIIDENIQPPPKRKRFKGKAMEILEIAKIGLQSRR